MRLFNQSNAKELPSVSIPWLPVFSKTGFCLSPLPSLAVLTAAQMVSQPHYSAILIYPVRCVCPANTLLNRTTAVRGKFKNWLPCQFLNASFCCTKTSLLLGTSGIRAAFDTLRIFSSGTEAARIKQKQVWHRSNLCSAKYTDVLRWTSDNADASYIFKRKRLTGKN